MHMLLQGWADCKTMKTPLPAKHLCWQTVDDVLSFWFTQLPETLSFPVLGFRSASDKHETNHSQRSLLEVSLF